MPPNQPPAITDLNDTPQMRPRRLRAVIVLTILGFTAALTALFVNWLFSAPTTFPVDTPITVEEGMSAKQIAALMEEGGYVRSRHALYLSLLLWHDPSAVKASVYSFSTPLTPRELAGELMTGHFGHDLTTLTLIEGERASHFASAADEALPDFDAAAFLTLATPYEGKLFPETYFVPATFTAEDLFALLRQTYEEKVAPLRPAIAESGLTEDDVITLASIVEREANSEESMRLVAGILRERLRIGMALQVDASLEYVLDKPLRELTAEDLKLDSPYNTYLTSDLPPTPIGNPGLTAIRAVLEPEPSDYLFYITGDDGEFYYARTFDEHRLNIARHLR